MSDFVQDSDVSVQPDIVITGVGLITPLGVSRAATWDGVRAARNGFAPLSAIEQELPPGSTGGQAPDLPEDYFPDLPREVRYLRFAIASALEDAGLDAGPLDGVASDRRGLLLGTTLHGMRAGGRFWRTCEPRMLAAFLAGATSGSAARGLGLDGFSATVCSACSSSLGSVALGVSLLRSGQLDLVVVGGYDTISEYVYGGFNSLRLVAPGPLRPFTRGRLGMKLAEGYGIIVLERTDDARARGGRAYATILGYGESSDAHHLTQPHPQGDGAARAMSAALAMAQCQPGEIDLVAAHATGTPDNDAAEYAAMARVFGADLARVNVVAFKSHLGHTLGGAGAVELILSALSLQAQVIPGCASITADDIEFSGLNVSCGPARPGTIRATLNTSLGFGGANTCVVLGAAPPDLARVDGEREELATSALRSASRLTDSARLAATQSGALGSAARPARLAAHTSGAPSVTARPVFITGVGVVLPGMIGNDAFAAAMSRPEFPAVEADTGGIPESDFAELLNARRVRRMSQYVKMSLAATLIATRDARIEDMSGFAEQCAAILGSTHGSTEYSEAYYGQIVREGIGAANPMLFAEGVPNAAAAHLSLMLAIKGPCQTVIGTRTAGLDALHLAATRIAQGQWDRAIVSAGEEYSAVVNNAYAAWGLYVGGTGAMASLAGGGFFAGAGAVTLILESEASWRSRGGKPRGRLLHSTGPISVAGAAPRRFREVGATLRDAHWIATSANRTWIDRLEALAIGAAGDRVIHPALDSSPWRCRPAQRPGGSRFAETFSVMPLAAIASALLARRLPTIEPSPLIGGPFGVICADYTHLLSTAVLALE